MAGKGTKFQDNPVMDYNKFISAANNAKKGYDKKANTAQKDADGTKIDQDLQSVDEAGKNAGEQAQKKASDASMHDGWSGDTPPIKKFTSKHLSQIKKLDNSEEKKLKGDND